MCVLFLAIASLACRIKESDPVPTNDSAILRVAVGQNIAAVERASGIVFHLDRLRDNSPVILEQVVSILYDDPNHGFQLPPTRFVMISQAAGIVTGVDTSPQLGFLDLAKAHDLAIVLRGQIETAHWEVVRAYPADLSLLERLIADPSRRGRFEKDYAELRAGNARLRLYIKEAIGIGLEGREPSPRGQLFLVNVDVTDEQLTSAVLERVYAKRRELTGSVNDSLPLSVWLHGESPVRH